MEYPAKMRSGCRLATSLIGLIVLAGTAGVTAQRTPDLQFEALEHPSDTTGIGRIDTQHLRTIVRLVGLPDPGGPIRVVLAAEDTAVARGTPSWIAGVAHGASDTVLLFPARSPRYPHDSLTAVLHHEIAHVLIHRAAAGHDIPRWFNEGLATIAERTWTFEDRRQLAWALAAGTPVRMHDLDPLFGQGPNAAARAYALGSAFVRNIVDVHGIGAPAQILSSIAHGRPFDAAFEEATGQSLREAERAFSVEVTTWERWIPLLTSPFVLWTATTLLALYAIVVFRQRRAEHRRRWEEDDGEEEDERGGELMAPHD
jgi:hypothetical protein